MKNRILVQTVVFLMLIFGIARTSYLQEQINVNVYINPPNAVVGVGETVSVDILADQVTELGGFELDLSFDPNVIKITKAEINNAFVIPVKEEIDNTSGTGSIAAATLSTPQSGTDIVVVTLEVTGVADGITGITLSGVILEKQGERRSHLSRLVEQ